MAGLNVKKGDRVKVIAGKDKGKEGEVIRAYPKKGRVVVEKVNIIKKAMRPTQQNPQGGAGDPGAGTGYTYQGGQSGGVNDDGTVDSEFTDNN